MRIHTTLSDKHIEQLLRSDPVSREPLVTIYSDDGIYEIRNKIHKVCIQDAPCDTRVLRNTLLQCDPSRRTLQERWQIPLPHDADETTESIYDVTPRVRLIFEQNHRTTYYFIADSCEAVVDWLETLERKN